MNAEILPSSCSQCGGPALVQYLRSGWRVICYAPETRDSCQLIGKSSWNRLEAVALWNDLGNSAPASLPPPKEQEVDLTESLFA